MYRHRHRHRHKQRHRHRHTNTHTQSHMQTLKHKNNKIDLIAYSQIELAKCIQR